MGVLGSSAPCTSIGIGAAARHWGHTYRNFASTRRGLAADYVRVNVRKLPSLAMWRQLTLLAGVGLLVAACGANVGTNTSQPPASETASTPSAAASPRELRGKET